MQPIKVTLTALVIAATVAGSAFAVDGSDGSSGATGNGDKDRASAPAATNAQQNTYPTGVTPQSNAQATEGVTGATPNSGETTTDKAVLKLRKQEDNKNSK